MTNTISLQELHALSKKELLEELKKARKEYHRYKLGIRAGSFKEIHLLNHHKKFIAQILTILKQEEKKLDNKAKEDTITLDT
jgi:ribosomal protein L29